MLKEDSTAGPVAAAVAAGSRSAASNKPVATASALLHRIAPSLLLGVLRECAMAAAAPATRFPVACANERVSAMATSLSTQRDSSLCSILAGMWACTVCHRHCQLTAPARAPPSTGMRAHQHPASWLVNAAPSSD